MSRLKMLPYCDELIPTQEPIGTPVVIVNPTPCPDTCIDPPFPTTVAMGAPLSINGDMCIVRPTATPSATVSATPSPTPPATETPLGNYHIACAIPSANVRNYPAGQTQPTMQIDGRVVLTLPTGSLVTVYELRAARDNIQWARITPYEGLNGRDTLWIRTKQPDNITDILLPGQPTTCPAIAANLAQPTLLPPTPSFPIGSPGCSGNNDCPHTSPTISDVDLVSFILACEAGAAVPNPANESIEDAISNAHVIYNRMDSGLYAGTARQVVSQSGQWQPYTEGCNNTLVLSNLSGINADIRDAAQQLVSNPPTEPQATPISLPVDWMALYTFGVFNPNHPAVPPSVDSMLGPYCPEEAMRVYLAIASFGAGARANASVFFSDGSGCVFN